MNPLTTTLLCALSFLLGRWSAKDRSRTRDLDKRLSPYENGRKHAWTDENKHSRAIL